MSLVNDMLRDLDQRRQEPAHAKVGTERLVPVSAAGRKSSVRRSFIGFVLTIAITLGLILGGYYFWQSMGTEPIVPIATQPVVVPAPTVDAGPSAEQIELQQIAQRMQELEAQNRALVEAQSAIAAQAMDVQTQLQEEIAQPALTVNSPIQSAEAVTAVPSGAQNQASVSAPQPVPNSQPAPNVEIQSTTEAPVSSSVIRSPRSPSFIERDQMQVQDAMRLAGNNQIPQAMQQLLEFVANNPNAHNSREAMVKLALQQGDTLGAEQLLQTGLSLDANRPGYLKLKARMLLSDGQAAEAMGLLSARVPSIQSDIEYHDILATTYLSSQNYERAAQSFQALVNQNRNEGRWWYGLASAWDSLGRTRDAQLAYEQAIKLPNLSSALRLRSQQRLAEIGL